MSIASFFLHWASLWADARLKLAGDQWRRRCGWLRRGSEANRLLVFALEEVASVNAFRDRCLTTSELFLLDCDPFAPNRTFESLALRLSSISEIDFSFAFWVFSSDFDGFLRSSSALLLLGRFSTGRRDLDPDSFLATDFFGPVFLLPRRTRIRHNLPVLSHRHRMTAICFLLFSSLKR